MLQFILVTNQDVAVRTIPAAFVQHGRVVRIYMDRQWYLAEKGFPAAFRTGGKTHLLVRIEYEAVPRGQLAELGEVIFLSDFLFAAHLSLRFALEKPLPMLPG